MGRKKFEKCYYVEMADFLTQYVFPLAGDYEFQYDEDGNIVERDDQGELKYDYDKLKGLSHLDLDELNIPGVKRVGDDDNYYNFDELILVAAPGYKHKGKEIHPYLRPFNVLKGQLEELGYTDEEVTNILLRKNKDYDFKELDSFDEITDSNGFKVKEKIKYDKF